VALGLFTALVKHNPIREWIRGKLAAKHPWIDAHLDGWILASSILGVVLVAAKLLYQPPDVVAGSVHDMQQRLKYQEVATFNVRGVPAWWPNPNTQRPAVWGMDEGLNITDKGISFRCDDKALAAFKDTIKHSPKFPFAYHGVALCLMERNDVMGLAYAQKAADILRVTTKIDGHAPGHDEILKYNEELLKNAKTYGFSVPDAGLN